MASIARTSDRDKLAKRLSSWAQREMGCEISPDAFLQLLHTPDMIENLTHIVSNVKSVNLQESLQLKLEDVAQPASAKLSWPYTQLREEDSELNLQIAQCKADLQLLLDIHAASDEKISKLESEVFMHTSKMQIINLYRSLCEKNIQNVILLISKIETSFSSLPPSTEKNSNCPQLTADLQEALEIVSEYYETSRRGECSKKTKWDVQNKLQNMAKTYKSEDYLDFLQSQKEPQELKLEEDYSYTQVTKKIINGCFFEMRTAHVESFATVQALLNKVWGLSSEKAELMKELASVVSADHLNLYKTRLEVIRKNVMTECLSDPTIPEGIPSLSYKDNLLSVQKQIEDEEESIKSLVQQVVKACKHSRKLLDHFQNTFMDESQQTDLECKDLQAKFNPNNFNEKLEVVENWLVKLNTSEPQLSDLSVRPNNQIIPNRIKVELQSALDMPLYEAPEMIGQRLLKKMESLWDNRTSAQNLSQLDESLDLESCKQCASKIFRSVEDSNSKAEPVVARADEFTQYINLLIKCEDLRECLNDLQEEPAFNNDIV